MKYMDKDGHSFEAASADELVHQLNESSQTPSKDDKRWMKASARRIKTQMGQKVSTESAETFVQDLLRLHLMVREQ
jgi:hypothetical protein